MLGTWKDNCMTGEERTKLSFWYSKFLDNYSVNLNFSTIYSLQYCSHLTMYQASWYLKTNLPVCLFPHSNGIKIGPPCQELRGVSKLPRTLKHPVCRWYSSLVQHLERPTLYWFTYYYVSLDTCWLSSCDMYLWSTSELNSPNYECDWSEIEMQAHEEGNELRSFPPSHRSLQPAAPFREVLLHRKHTENKSGQLPKLQPPRWWYNTDHVS